MNRWIKKIKLCHIIWLAALMDTTLKTFFSTNIDGCFWYIHSLWFLVFFLRIISISYMLKWSEVWNNEIHRNFSRHKKYMALVLSIKNNQSCREPFLWILRISLTRVHIFFLNLCVFLWPNTTMILAYNNTFREYNG